MQTHPPPDFPLHSPDFYAGDPYPAYRELRATAPVCWNDVTKFWALLKYEDIRYVSSNPALFTSTEGITIPDPAIPSPVQAGNLIFSDPPRHRQLRKLVNSGFTRRRVAVLEPKIREIVRGLLDGVEPGSVHEFAEELAAPLPTRMIAELIGAPPDDWEQFRAWSDAATGSADPEIELDSLVAMGQLFEYFQKLIAVRRTEPRDDMLSVLVEAEIDEHRLTDEDLLNFAFLLLVAGNETTRNLIALGTLALIAHPEQRRLLAEDPARIPLAVEEMLRWNSPVTHMARTATADIEIRGQRIRAGETVVMLYGSANRDEDIFGPDSEEFNVTRHPNPHIAFGCGEHSCVGAQLARLEATVFFDELLRRFPDLELVGNVDRMRATMVPGVKRMPVRMGPESMDLEYTPEQEKLRAEMRATLEQVMTPERVAAISDHLEGGPAVRECVRALAAANLLGVGWPKEYGGQGFSAIEQFIFSEEARRASAPIPLVTLNTVGPTLMHFGSEEQKQKFLPAILDGTVEFAIGYSEPGAGSDLASVRTTAVRDGSGPNAGYVINGQKMFTSGAAYADYIWLAVRTDPEAKKHKGISILIVPTSSPGFSWQPLHTMPGISTFYTFYDDVRVPASAVVGGENQGWQLITTQLNFERAALGNLGALEPLFEKTLDWAISTELDGGRVIDQPWVQSALARVEAQVAAYKLVNSRVNAAMTKGALSMGQASAAKVFGTELTQQVARELLEVLDGNGVRRGGDAPLRGALESAYRQAVINTFGGGANEIQRDIIAMAGLGMPRAPRDLRATN